MSDSANSDLGGGGGGGTGHGIMGLRNHGIFKMVAGGAGWYHYISGVGRDEERLGNNVWSRPFVHERMRGARVCWRMAMKESDTYHRMQLLRSF